MKNSTIIDIAKRLKVSPSTVSRALNDIPGTNKETKNLVKKVAKEMEYLPNPIAKSLKNSKTTTIGVIVPLIKHDFFSSAISGIEEIAYHSGYTIIVCQSNESYEREVLNAQLLMRHRVAGVIISISQDTKKSDHLRDLLRRKIPIVFFDRVCKDIEASKIMIDDYNSAYNAVEYLIRKGRTKIVHFAGPCGVSVYEERLRGYSDAMMKNRISIIDGMVLHAGLDARNGYETMDSLLNSSIIPDAIFTVNDPVAFGAFKRIKEAGLGIPDDIAVIGFSNNAVSSVFTPSLTTIDQFPFEMGKKAAEILIETIQNKVASPRKIIIDTKLIVRESA